MAKEKTPFDEIAGPEEFTLTNEEIRDILAVFKRSFGGYGPTGINKFYEKAGVGRVEWQIKKEDKTYEDVPSGRLVSATVIRNIKGTPVWRNYKYPSDIPLDFYNEVFKQVDKYLGKVEFAKTKQLEQLTLEYDNTNTPPSVLPGGNPDETDTGNELHFSGGVPLPNQE